MARSSFRLRMALGAGLVTGGLLLASGLGFWQAATRRDMDRVDRELHHLARTQLERVNGTEHWARFDESLRVLSGNRELPMFLLRVWHDGREIYRSPIWPAGVDRGSLPEPGDYEAPFHAGAGPTQPRPPRREQPISRSNPPLPRREPRFRTLRSEGHTWRIGVFGNPYLTLVLASDLEDVLEDRYRLRNSIIGTLAAGLLFAGLGAGWLAKRALRPVERLTETVERISARGLDRRLDLPAHDRELETLVRVFNAMMDRLESGFGQARRFSADAAHELRTPLTVLQLQLEMELRQCPDGSEAQGRCAEHIEEVERLRAIVERLLLLSQADAGHLPIIPEPIGFSELVRETMEDLRILAPGITIVAEIPSEIRIEADRVLLTQVVANLATNAARHNDPDGRIKVRIDRTDREVSLRIANTGPGIPARERQRIFDRFHRVDSARSREHGGVGLGLSLSREIARAHGGDLILEETQPPWTSFRLHLPLPRGREEQVSILGHV